MKTIPKKLKAEIISKSKANSWPYAVQEWLILDDRYVESGIKCICGKHNVKHAFILYNPFTSIEIDNVGSTCARLFDTKLLQVEAKVLRQQEFLMHSAIARNDVCAVPFSSKYYPELLLKKMYIDGAFKPNKFNNFNPRNDYEFLLKMLYKKKTRAQKQKIHLLIENYIRP